MDVFDAVDTRIACRWFLNKPVDPNIIRNLIAGAARAASNGNVQPWIVYAVTGEPLKEIKRQVAGAIEKKDWRTFETEYPDFLDGLWEPYLSRSFRFGVQLYGHSVSTVKTVPDGSSKSNAITNFSTPPLGSSSRSIAGSAPANGRT
jgi:nitroreductase